MIERNQQQCARAKRQDAVTQCGHNGVEMVCCVANSKHNCKGRDGSSKDLRSESLHVVSGSHEQSNPRTHGQRIHSRRHEEISPVPVVFAEQDHKRAQEQAANDAQRAKYQGLPNPFYEQRPNYIELFFGGQRPEMSNPQSGGDLRGPDQGDGPANVEKQTEMNRFPIVADEKHYEGEGIENRENSESASRVELFVITLIGARVPEDSGNQEAREHKKQIHSGPSEPAERSEDSRHQRMTVHASRAIVISEHKQNGNTSQAIQGRVFLQGRSFWGKSEENLTTRCAYKRALRLLPVACLPLCAGRRFAAGGARPWGLTTNDDVLRAPGART